MAVLIAVLIASRGDAARKARGTVKGTITSTVDEPLAGVEITLETADGERATATTDKRGKFSITVAVGDYVLAMEGEGYVRFESPLSVEAGGQKVVSVQLLDVAEGRRNEAAQAFNAGADAFEAGDKAAARESFLAALAADPTLLEAHRVLATIYLDEGAWAEAAQAAETFLAAQPGERQVRLIAYEAYRQLGDPVRAGEMRRALAADPELASKLALHAFNEGAIADQEGDSETAAARFEEALELDARLAAAHFALATLEYRAKRFEEALAALQGGLALEPASPHGRRLGFIVHDARGDQEAAAKALDAYAEVDPARAAELLFKRAEVEFRNDETTAARTTLAKVLRIEPDHAGAHHILGLAYLKSDAEAAARHLRRFLELAPEDPESAAVKEILANL
jgi:Tfp pilus assembly protein PilF